MTRIRMAISSLVVSIAIAVAVRAAPIAAPATRPAATDFLVSRLDVVRAYARLDQALARHPLTNDAERDRVNRDADEATRFYFRRNYPATVKALDELAESISPDLSKSLEAQVARSMRVRVGPRVALEKRPTPLRVKITSSYPVAIDRPVTLKFIIRRDDDDDGNARGKGEVVFEQDITIDANGLCGGITAGQPKASTGRYRVELVAPDGAATRVADWFVTDRSLHLLRQANEQRRLPFIRQTSFQLAQATSAVAARNAMISDQLVDADPAAALADPIALANEVDRELKELAEDRDPFVDRAGDYWRTITVGSFPVPARVYAPAGVIGQRVPLLVVLPGIGNDETQFMEGIGGRSLRKLADEYGMLVVVPQTSAIVTAPEPIEMLVRALGMDYLIDRSRVYLIGYSTGGGTAIEWSRRQASHLSGVCVMGSLEEYRPTATPTPAPTLVINGEMDPIAPTPSQKSFDEYKRQGQPIELRIVSHAGHTLLPIDALPDAIKWLSTQARVAAK